MQTGDFAPEFPLEWALKDVDLALAVAGGAELPLLWRCPGSGARRWLPGTAGRTSAPLA